MTVITIICPYCKHPNRLNVDLEVPYFKYCPMYCDVEEGGCNKPFIFKITSVSATTYVSKLEGDGK